MKLLKIIEILKDRSQWTTDTCCGEIKHKPTGIYAYGGYTFWKDGESIYEPNPWAALFTIYYVGSIRKYLQNKDQKNSLDNIYLEWKLNFDNQSY